ncbi:MAG TPA: hypothetical protein VGF77_06485 [Allosphingosinicella sp.]|jgi:hypothetical protein
MLSYDYYPVVMQPDPNLSSFIPDVGSFTALAGSPKGRTIIEVLTSVAGVNLLLGSILAAPSRPPVVAVERVLTFRLPENAFDDDTKRFIGRLIRKIVEHLGGRWVRKGVKITVPSTFSKGSIYSF